MTLWIILGSLIGVVAIFLITASVLDRKKVKKNRIEEDKHRTEVENSIGNVAIWVSLVFKANETTLKKFKPSVGKLKMSDIRRNAKKALELLKQQNAYKLMRSSEDNKELTEAIKVLTTTNSNIWDKRCKAEMKLFNDLAKDATDTNHAAFKGKARVKIAGVYDVK